MRRDRRNRAIPSGQLVFIALFVIGCTRTTETRSESASQATAALQETKIEALTETVQTGPETITTTVEEYDVPVLDAGTASGPLRADIHGEAKPSDTSGSVSPAAPVTGSLIHFRRTVTVDQRGPSVDTKRQNEKEASTATLAAQSEAKTATKTKTSYSPSWFVWLALAGLLAGVFAVLRGWLKMPLGV